MFKKIKEFMFSKGYSIEERRFILTGTVACVAVFAVLLSTITSNQSMRFSVILVLMEVLMAGIIYLSIKTKKYTLGASLILFISNVLVVPPGYMLGGGIDSGAALWLVLALVIVFVYFRGKMLLAFFLITCASFAVTIFTSEYHPEWVVPLQEGYTKYMDTYISLILVSFSIGMLFFFQNSVLEKEIENTDKQRDEIEKLNEQQNSFFSSMSHEIRTPISTIIGLNEMTMREKSLPAEVLENTVNIQTASKMLLSLINDLLDMSKIQSGNMEIVPTEYDTSSMLSDITNLHWNRAMEKNLSFDIEVADNIPPTLYGDETRIKQVIVNLLSNAIKYTDEGSVILRFGGEKINDDKFMLNVDVEDTGMGIRKENIQYLFDAFRRVEGEDTKNIEGTGLGLSIAKQLVELMGGNITVNSIYTKGSVFRVEIPQGVVAGEGATFRKPDLMIHEKPEYQHSFEAPKATVLVVDDNDMNRIVCRKLLRATRVKVDLAESGRECLEMTREKHYDAIFMDHEMPQMDGIETLHKIRQQTDGLCRETPVVALTANAGSDMDAFYMEKGFSAYLSKPIQSSRLEAILMACLPADLIEHAFVESEEESVQITGAVHKRPFIVTTDSICDIPLEYIRQFELEIMPYYISTAKGRFRDIEEIDSDNLEQMEQSERNMVTSLPASVEEYEEFFGNALTEARTVVHISSSKDISSAYYNASTAADSFGNVHVIDSGLSSSGLGLMVLRAADMLSKGMRFEELEKDLDQYRKTISVDYIVPSILSTSSKYKGNLIARIMMSTFNLEPSFVIRKGRIRVKRFLFGYVRTTHEEFIRGCFLHKNNIKTKRLIVTFSGCSPELRQHILEEIEHYIQFDEIILNKCSAATYVNCGSNAIGLTYETKG